MIGYTAEILISAPYFMVTDKLIKLWNLITILAKKCKIFKITLKKMDSRMITILRNVGQLFQSHKYHYIQLKKYIIVFNYDKRS